MSSTANLYPINFDAGADLSASQYKVVQYSGDNAVEVAEDGGGFGLLQNNPTLGAAAAVQCRNGGKAKGLIGGTVGSAGIELASNASGELIIAVAGKFVICTSTRAQAAGDIASVLMQANAVKV